MNIVQKVGFMLLLPGVMGSGSLNAYYNPHYNHSNDAAFVLSCCSVACAGALCLYCLTRTPNGELCYQVDKFSDTAYTLNFALVLERLKDASDIYQVQNIMYQYSNVFSVARLMYDDVERLYAEVKSRYDTALKPWNNTYQMEQAYHSISEVYYYVGVLDIVAYYFQHYFDITSRGYSQYDFEQQIRRLVNTDTQFPLIKAVVVMQQDVQSITKWAKRYPSLMVLGYIQQDIERLISYVRGCSNYAIEQAEYKRLQLEQERLSYERQRVIIESERLQLERDRLEHEKKRDRAARY